jgi:hypothetical protein
MATPGGTVPAEDDPKMRVLEAYIAQGKGIALDYGKR